MKAVEPGLGEDAAQFLGDRHRLREPGARLRIEVNAQLVRIVRIVGPGSPGMEHHRIHLHRPHCGGDFLKDQLGMRACAGIFDVDRTDKIRRTLGRVLGEELFAVDGVLEPLECNWPAAVRRHEGVPDVHYVAGQIQLA